MRKEVIYTQKNLYRADMNIYGYHFGKANNRPVSWAPAAAMKSSSSISVPSL